MRIILFLLLLLPAFGSSAQQQTRLTIYFATDKYTIRQPGALLLDSLAASFPATKEGISIEIYGHCDARGTEEYNDELSMKRVKAVERYLLAKGIGPSMIIKEKGYGELMPVTDERTIYQQALNRRVELVITRQEEKTFTETIRDTSVKAGNRIMLKNLNFYGGSHILLPQSMPVLQELLAAMQNNPQLVIAIEGHICCLPDNSDGVDIATGIANLSEARAKAVYDHLLKNGIARNRISYHGFGHRFPMYPYPERSEEESIQNRRVEIMIINK